jgi:CubicO group peptidase (beta-lactamase class C family)
MLRTLRDRLSHLLLAICYAALACPGQDFASKIDEYLNGQKLSGSVLVAKAGKILVSRGYGMASYELDVPNKPNTKFRLGSITKQFTATAVLQLQERGKLNVDDLVSKYVTDAPDAWKEITIHHLLTHTSGLHGSPSSLIIRSGCVRASRPPS